MDVVVVLLMIALSLSDRRVLHSNYIFMNSLTPCVPSAVKARSLLSYSSGESHSGGFLNSKQPRAQ